MHTSCNVYKANTTRFIQCGQSFKKLNNALWLLIKFCPLENFHAPLAYLYKLRQLLMPTQYIWVSQSASSLIRIYVFNCSGSVGCLYKMLMSYLIKYHNSSSNLSPSIIFIVEKLSNLFVVLFISMYYEDCKPYYIVFIKITT